MSQEKKTLKYDFCVIGAGSGGLTFAAAVRQLGASVVLLEQHKMGGDCLNYGCVPSKALIASAKIAHCLKKAHQKLDIDFSKVHKYVYDVIHTLSKHDSVERFEEMGVKVILEKGSFFNKSTVETQSYYIRAKKFIIATGSHPFVPPIEGISKVPFYTNETIFDLKEAPKHLAIVGGGPIGVEMAQAFYRLGSKVTIIEAFGILSKDEPVIARDLKDILLKEGVKILEQTKITSMEQHGAHTTIHLMGTDETVEASHVLIATGQRAHVGNLGLDKACIKTTERGIFVDDYLRTSNNRVFAIGDCIGGYQFTHVAAYHARIVIQNSVFWFWKKKMHAKAIPWVTYTDPELAHVGLLESQIKQTYTVTEVSFEDNDRAHTEKSTEGKIRVCVSKKGRVLGVSILSKNAGELIYPWVMVIENNLKISSMKNVIAPYPTFSVVHQKVVAQYYKKRFLTSFVKKVIRVLLKFV